MHRRRRPRLDAAPRQRPDPGGLRDGHRAADDGHPQVRHLRPGRDHRRLVPRRHERNIIPDAASSRRRCGRSRRGRGPRRARVRPGVRGHRRRARPRRRGRPTAGVPGDRQRRRARTTSSPTRSATSSARSGSSRCRPDHRLRGLLPRPRARCPARRSSSARLPGSTRRPRRTTTRRAPPSTTACSPTAPRCWPNSPSAASGSWPGDGRAQLPLAAAAPGARAGPDAVPAVRQHHRAVARAAAHGRVGRVLVPHVHPGAAAVGAPDARAGGGRRDPHLHPRRASS